MSPINWLKPESGKHKVGAEGMCGHRKLVCTAGECGLQQSFWTANWQGLGKSAKEWKQPICPPSDEWINKMWYVDTMEYYPTLTRREVLLYTTMWINSYEMSRIGKAIETESRLIFA